MQDSVMPRLVEGQPSDSLARLPQRNADNAPQRVAFAIKEHGSWRDVTTSQFLIEVRALAKGFIANGIEAGDRIAIMARTRYEWTLVDFAAWMAAAVPVSFSATGAGRMFDSPRNRATNSVCGYS